MAGWKARYCKLKLLKMTRVALLRYKCQPSPNPCRNSEDAELDGLIGVLPLSLSEAWIIRAKHEVATRICRADGSVH
jgi:hypothetical protein